MKRARKYALPSKDDSTIRKWGQSIFPKKVLFLPSNGPAERIINSGKLRARQTAEIVALSIAPTLRVEDVAEGLRPNDSTDWLAGNLQRWTGDTVVVGYLPFMGKMVSRRVTGSEDAPIVSFVPGTAVCLARDETGEGWTIAWMITPDLLRP